MISYTIQQFGSKTGIIKREKKIKIVEMKFLTSITRVPGLDYEDWRYRIQFKDKLVLGEIEEYGEERKQTNSMAYGTQRFNTTVTRALQ